MVVESNFVIKGDLTNLAIGCKTQIQNNCTFHLGGYKWSGYQGKIEIGKNAVIGSNSVLIGAGPYGIIIGDNFDGGPGVVISSSKTKLESLHNHDFAKVIIGDNVTLYANVVVSPGATIGNNCVIGANSVVKGMIPDHSLAIGNPAVVVKSNIRK